MGEMLKLYTPLTLGSRTSYAGVPSGIPSCDPSHVSPAIDSPYLRSRTDTRKKRQHSLATILQIAIGVRCLWSDVALGLGALRRMRTASG
jgi:hypothetical protein